MMDATPATDRFFADFVAATGAHGTPTVGTFGDSAELITELVALVLEGRKRATASLEREFEPEGTPQPAVGDHWIVVGAAGEPVCICRTEDVRRGPISSVDKDFAWDEGEGDRSRDQWLEEHDRYFRRQAEREGWEYTATEPAISERSAVVWPPAIAHPP